MQSDAGARLAEMDRLHGVDEAARIRLGASPDTAPALLQVLAGDASLAVRAAVALNQASPPLVDLALAHDPDARVRMVLARKLAALAPGLSDAEHAELARHVWGSLALLVEDEVTRVRGIVAELVKELPEAPRGLILRLAHDTEFPVSDPVLRLSPALTEEDLLALLHAAPAAHTARSIALRQDVTETIADAIAQSASNEAIRCLLSNHAAAIRESTLDALVDRARRQLDWHEPLVRRPALSARSAQRLSLLVTEWLGGILAGRPDIGAAVASDLRARLAGGGAPAYVPPSHDPGPGGRYIQGRQMLDEARRLQEAGALTEAVVIAAIRNGQLERLRILIAVAAGVRPEAVVRAGRLRSAKAVISLIWRTGFSMRIAGATQAMLCNLTPDAMLRQAPGGGFPLSDDEMRWQIEFINHGS